MLGVSQYWCTSEPRAGAHTTHTEATTQHNIPCPSTHTRAHIHTLTCTHTQVELSEAQRMLGAKERSIDSLRDTLATTKRTYESRLAQVEGQLSLKEAEVGVWGMRRGGGSAEGACASTVAQKVKHHMHATQHYIMYAHSPRCASSQSGCISPPPWPPRSSPCRRSCGPRAWSASHLRPRRQHTHPSKRGRLQRCVHARLIWWPRGGASRSRRGRHW